ncbi:MAG: hypothetical protein HWD59_03775 [Coxiellaceae bacterium]|nr:MAG: hypothetical protein HWD59_03775 [Coxiellaceae bacterium]
MTPLIQQEQELEWLIELYRMAEPVFENYCQQLIRRIQLCLVKENDDDIELILPEDTWPNLAEEAVTQLEFFYSLESWLKAKKS